VLALFERAQDLDVEPAAAGEIVEVDVDRFAEHTKMCTKVVLGRARYQGVHLIHVGMLAQMSRLDERWVTGV